MGQRHQDAQRFIMPVIADTVAEPHPDFALGAFARKIYTSRRQRDKKSPLPGLFQDPAWDILLDLFIAHTEHKNISLKSVGLAGHVPPTTALRWVETLENAHLVSRKPDESDKRRSFVSLTPEGISYMREILENISKNFQ